MAYMTYKSYMPIALAVALSIRFASPASAQTGVRGYELSIGAVVMGPMPLG